MRREILVGLILFVVGAVCLRVFYVRNGNMIYDEYQHMHAAWLLASGQTPFLDFFAHHLPLFYYLATLVIPLENPSFDTLITARYLALVFHLASIVIAAFWVRRFAGWRGGLLVAVLLLAHVRFFVWGCRVYLDTFAAPFLLLSTLLLPVRHANWKRSLLSALSLGVAILFTQKAVFVGFAPVAVFLCRAARELRESALRSGWLRDLGAYALGAVLTAAALPLLLGWDGFQALIRDAVVLNLNWKARHSAARELWELASSDAFLGIISVAWMAVALGGVARRRFTLTAADVPCLSFLGLCLGMLLLPVVWEEYFVIVLPFAIVVAGQCLLTVWRRQDEPSGRGHVASYGLAIIALFLVADTFNLYGLLRPFDRQFSRLEMAILVGVPVAWIGGLLAARWFRNRHRGWQAVSLLVVFVAFPLSHQALWVRHTSNRMDRARVDFVMQHTALHEPVFDARSGWGVFRPHAYWYWCLHDEMQLMMTEEEKSGAIIRAIETRRPPIAIVDEFTRMLPEEVLEHISANYRDSPFPRIKVRIDEP